MKTPKPKLYTAEEVEDLIRKFIKDDNYGEDLFEELSWNNGEGYIDSNGNCINEDNFQKWIENNLQ